MEPFKIRSGEGDMALSVAREIFGSPSEVSVGPNTTSMTWRFYEDVVEVGLSLSYFHGNDTVDISFSTSVIRDDQTLCGVYRPGSTRDKLVIFVERVRKPWSEWEEEEVMEKPMWICLFKEQTGSSTPAMENMMAMLSFEDPDNVWVKRHYGRKPLKG